MNKYYTSITTENEQFVGIVYNSNTNQEIYKTSPHSSQLKAVQEINSFLQNKTGIPSRPVQITNTVKPTIITERKRCCGR